MMAEFGGLEVVPIRDGRLGEGDFGSPEAQGVGSLSEEGVIASPEVRRSERKKSLRSISARSRLAFSRPKSPLLRMAEMRKGGLKGRALHHLGLKGVEGSVTKVFKGKKRAWGKGVKMLASIPECNEACGGLMEVSGGGEGVADGGNGEEVPGGGEGVVMEEVRCVGDSGSQSALSSTEVCLHRATGQSDSPVRGLGVGCPKSAGQSEVLLMGMQYDLALDLIFAQPLQEMAFVGKQDSSMLEVGSEEVVEGELSEEFPLLSKENLKLAKEKERDRTGGEERGQGWLINRSRRTCFQERRVRTLK